MRQLILAAILAAFCWPAYANHLEADANGYIAQYERHVDIPVPTGVVDCTGDSAVNPNAANELIIRPGTVATSWDDVNSAAYDLIFVCPGGYTSVGVIDLTQSGTSAAPRKIVWWTDSGYDADLHPVDMLTSQEAIVDGFSMEGADWLVVDRITFDPSANRGVHYPNVADSDNNVFNRIVIDAEDVDPGALGFQGYHVGGFGNEFNTLQNSVVRNCTRNDNKDNHGTSFGGNANYNTIVNNEIYNCSDGFHADGIDVETLRVRLENNDIYVTTDLYVDCATGEFTATGDCVCAENGIDWKADNDSVTAGDVSHVVHNRIWGYRPQDDSGNQCGGTGSPGGAAVVLGQSSANILFERNIVADTQNGVDCSSKTSTQQPQRNTVQRNLFHDIERHYTGIGTSQAMRASNCLDSLYQQNTVVESADSVGYLFRNGDNAFVCNLIVNTPGASGLWTGDGFEDMNGYVGTTPNGDDTTLFDLTLAEADLGQFCYFRKLLTGPEQVCVSNVIPSATSPVVGACSDYTVPAGFGAG